MSALKLTSQYTNFILQPFRQNCLPLNKNPLQNLTFRLRVLQDHSQKPMGQTNNTSLFGSGVEKNDILNYKKINSLLHLRLEN